MSPYNANNRNPVRTDQWKRIIKISLLFAFVAPFVGFILLIISLALHHLFITRTFDLLLWNLSSYWLSYVGLSYLVGAAPAIILGGAFAMISVLTQWRQLWVALVLTTIINIVFVFWLLGVKTYFDLSSVVSQFLNTGAIYFLTGFASLFMLPTSICWYLSRRWNDPVFLKRAL